MLRVEGPQVNGNLEQVSRWESPGTSAECEVNPGQGREVTGRLNSDVLSMNEGEWVEEFRREI